MADLVSLGRTPWSRARGEGPSYRMYTEQCGHPVIATHNNVITIAITSTIIIAR